MRMQRTVLYILFPAFLCYYTVVAHASLHSGGFASPASGLARSVRLPGLVLPAGLSETVSVAVGRLRQAVTSLARPADTRPGVAKDHEASLPLWVDLEPTVASPDPTLTGQASPYGVLLPGQD